MKPSVSRLFWPIAVPVFLALYVAAYGGAAVLVGQQPWTLPVLRVVYYPLTLTPKSVRTTLGAFGWWAYSRQAKNPGMPLEVYVLLQDLEQVDMPRG